MYDLNVHVLNELNVCELNEINGGYDAISDMGSNGGYDEPLWHVALRGFIDGLTGRSPWYD